jgi:hypothetical protein
MSKTSSRSGLNRDGIYYISGYQRVRARRYPFGVGVLFCGSDTLDLQVICSMPAMALVVRLHADQVRPAHPTKRLCITAEPDKCGAQHPTSLMFFDPALANASAMTDTMTNGQQYIQCASSDFHQHQVWWCSWLSRSPHKSMTACAKGPEFEPRLNQSRCCFFAIFYS